MWQEFVKIGKLAWEQGLFSSHGGNMSVRIGDRLLITRRGSMLGSLTKDDVIETSLNENDAHVTLASTELVVHRAIYQNTSALAIFHAHPPCAVALSMLLDEIVPEDSEGSHVLKKVPVIKTELTVGAKEVAEKLPQHLKDFKLVMLRSHGSFAVGTLLEEAFSLTSSLEHSCKISRYCSAFGGKTQKSSPW